MKTSYLFPYRLKRISGIVFWLSLVLFIVLTFFDENAFESINPEVKVFAVFGGSGIFGGSGWFGWIDNSILDEILFFLFNHKRACLRFFKRKTEDEMVSKIRLDSLVWATYFNYILILLCYMLVYGMAFLNIMMIALFSHLLFFIIRFRWMMYKQNKISDYEE